MKRSKFSEEQIVYAIRQTESGAPVGDLCRQLGISDTTFFAGKKKLPPEREQAAPTSVVGGRKQPIETARRRPLARQTHAVGGPAKNS
jgi:transposase-like protein